MLNDEKRRRNFLGEGSGVVVSIRLFCRYRNQKGMPRAQRRWETMLSAAFPCIKSTNPHLFQRERNRNSLASRWACKQLIRINLSELQEGLIKSHDLVPWSTADVGSEAWLYRNDWAVSCSGVSHRWIFCVNRLCHSTFHPVEKFPLLSSWCRMSASDTPRMGWVWEYAYRDHLYSCLVWKWETFGWASWWGCSVWLMEQSSWQC